jgi:hypothetical protein
MTATKQDETKPEPIKIDLKEEPKKPDVMGIERDDKNCRVSFTTDGNLVIITIPVGNMPRVVAHGFIYELHEIVGNWYKERMEIKKKLSLDNREAVSKFSFKNGINKILGR